MKDELNKNKLLQHESIFWSPDYLEISSAWIEHIPFAFWIIEVLKPKFLVELGVHSGTSYFSFCQAVKKMNYDAVCYGIDTWKGDEQAGFYGEEVFEKVTNHNNREYSRFSTLIRSTFDEAKEYFVDGSIDLLHIDGLHTYDVVKHDFQSWFPKLSKGSLVLFHDINVRERNFGVFKLWEELKQEYPSLQFDFGYGLGVLAVGRMVKEELKELFVKNTDDPYFIFLRNIFSERGAFFKSDFYSKELLKQEGKNDQVLIAVNTQLSEDNKLLEINNEQLNEHKRTLELKNAQLSEQNRTLELTNTPLQANIEALEITNRELKETQKELSEDFERLKEQHVKLESTHRQLQEKYQKNISHLKEKLKKVESSFGNLSTELSATKEENALFKKHILWYRDTYETRSVLGVLKEKLIPKRKKRTTPASSANDQIMEGFTHLSDTPNGTEEINKNPFTDDLVIRHQADNSDPHDVCLFSSFSFAGKVEEYVFFYLAELKKTGFSIVFISTSPLSDSCVSRLSQYTFLIIERENKCPDFGSWKAGLSMLNCEELNSILLANDSVFGPFVDLGDIISSMKNEYDVWGMTENYEIDYHLQSYFLYFNKRAITSEIFKNFWINVDLSATKDEVINKYEVGISKLFRDNGFKLGAYADINVISKDATHGRKVVNPLLVFAKPLIKKYQFPFFKRELIIKRNISKAYDHLHFYVNVAGWRKAIKESTSYPMSYIDDFISSYYKFAKAYNEDLVLAKRKILFLSDTAEAGETRRVLINFLQWLKRETSICVETLICHQGSNTELATEFAKFGMVTDLYSLSEEEKTNLKKRLVDEISLVFSNTIKNVEAQKFLSFLDVPQVIYVHEQESTLRDVVSADNNIQWIKDNIEQLIASTEIARKNVAKYLDVNEKEIPLIRKFVTPYNTCDLAKVHEEIRSNLQIPPGSFVVGISGKLGCEDLGDLLPVISANLCKDNGDTHIVWLGGDSSSPAYRTTLVDLERAGLSQRVHILEESANTAPLFVLFDVFVICSREHSLSLQAFENGLIGNPVIYFQNSQGADEYERLGIGHSVPYLDVAALSQRILTYYQNRSNLKSDRSLTAQVIKNNFTTEILAPALLQLVNKYYDKEEVILAEDPLLTFMTHIYYDNSWEEIRDKLKNFNNGKNYFLFSISEGCIIRNEIIENIKSTFKNAFFLMTPNVGRDIGGKMALIDLYLSLGIRSSYIVILHDKQSIHSLLGESWKKQLFKVIDLNNQNPILSLFRDPKVGLVGVKDYIINEYNPATNSFRNNNQLSKKLLKEFNLSIENYDFMGGCIFWIKSSIIEKFFTKNNPLLIRATLEAGNVLDLYEERLTHTWERMFSWIATDEGYRIEGI